MTSQNKWYVKKPLSEQELLEIIEQDDLFDEFMIPLDNNQDTDVESDSEDLDNPEDDNNWTANNNNNTPDEQTLQEKDEEEILQENDNENQHNEEQNSENQDNENQSPVETIINRKWDKIEKETVVPEDYRALEGINEEVFSTTLTPKEVFITLLGPALENIVFQSNLYSTQKGKSLRLSNEELLNFIGINFLMAYHTVPNISCFWSSNADLHVPLVAKAMSRNRFQEILSNLHVNDNSLLDQNNKDKLYKVRPLIETLNNQFAQSYYGTRILSVDESIVRFKGRHSLKQYNPMKPIKRGFKLWCLSDKHGFVKKFDVYQGKNATVEEKFKGFNLGERVVLQLTEDQWGKKKIIYFDNYFCTVNLLEKLKLENTLACGTIRMNRVGNPKNLKSDKLLKRGEFDCRISNTGISFFKWKDNKIVTLSSNYHGTESTKVSRKEKNGQTLEVPAPLVIKDYNAHMGSVDHHDQLRSCYTLDRRCKKWWHRLFWSFIEIAFVNAYVIAKHFLHLDEAKSLLSFRRDLTMGLLTRIPSKRSNKRNSHTSQNKRRRFNYSVPTSVRLDNLGSHWVRFVNLRRRCENCSSKGIQSKPFSVCSACGVHLCVNEKKNCFAEYHEMEF